MMALDYTGSRTGSHVLCKGPGLGLGPAWDFGWDPVPRGHRDPGSRVLSTGPGPSPGWDPVPIRSGRIAVDTHDSNGYNRRMPDPEYTARGIKMTPEEWEMLGHLMAIARCRSRSEMVRKLIREAFTRFRSVGGTR